MYFLLLFLRKLSLCVFRFVFSTLLCGFSSLTTRKSGAKLKALAHWLLQIRAEPVGLLGVQMAATACANRQYSSSYSSLSKSRRKRHVFVT